MSLYQRVTLILLFLAYYFRLTFIVHPSLLQMDLMGEILTSERAEQKYKLAQGDEYQQCLNEFMHRITVDKENLNEEAYEIRNAERKWADLEEAGLFVINKKKLKRMFRQQNRRN